VALKYAGERKMKNSRAADVLELTFENVGITPKNRYEVLVDKETKLVGEWIFFSDAADKEPRFNIPWVDWHKVGNIMLLGNHGRGNDWKLATYEALPRTVFEAPEPVQLKAR